MVITLTNKLEVAGVIATNLVEGSVIKWIF